MAGTTLKLNVQGLDPQASDPQQQIPQAPPPPPPPLNFAQFASNPLAQQKVSAMVPGLPPPPPPAQPQTPPRPPSPIATMAAQNPKGLVAPGNLPIWNRPVVQNADGTHSSEYSTSFQDENGREVLVPTVVGGKFLTPDGTKPPEGSPAEQAMFQQAWQHYLKTGENLGAFDNPDNADAYSMALHNRGPAPNYPFGPSPSQPQGQISPQATTPVTGLPTLQQRLSQASGPSPAQAPMQSMPDWQQANPGQQEQKYSGLQKALQIAAGIFGGGVPGGVAAGRAIHQHDLDSGIQAINQQRYQQQVVQPYQTQQGIADTQAQMEQRAAAAQQSQAKAEDYSLQTLTAPQAAALGNPALEGTQMTSRDLVRLLGTHETATASQANAKTRADATTTAATTRAGGVVTAANIRANAPGKGHKAAAGDNIPQPGDPGFEATVQAVAEGRQPIPRYSSRSAALINAANKLNPKLDGTTFATYQASQKNMTSGTAGQAINSFNTALQHLGEVEAHMPANGQFPVANSIHNALIRSSGDPRLGAFDTARTAVLSEIAKAYHGGVVPQADEAKYEKLLDPNASPAQMKANIEEFKGLLSGKLESYNYQRQQGQPGTQGGPIMSPGASAVMNEGGGGYTNLHINRQTNQTIGTKKGDTSGKWYDTKTGQEYTGGR